MKVDTHCVGTLAKRHVRIWLVLLLLMGVFIRVYGANDYAYSPDEAMLTEIASARDAVQVLKYSLYESHPPLGNFLRHYWMRAGSAPWFVRSESLLFGLGCILVYYAIGKYLAGEVAGLCCAVIVTFSRGCVIQSYVARNYIFFLFFISLAFYSYLKWRNERRFSSLAGYTIFACFAGTTHFSTVFTVFCIGLCESVALFRRRAELREWALWLAANAIIFGAIACLYVLWLPMLRQLSLYFSTASLGWHTRLEVMLLQPLGIPLYLLPAVSSALPLTCLFAAVALRPNGIARENGNMHFLAALMLSGLILGMALFIADIYTPVGSRHNLWVFPFVIPVLGLLSADALAALARGGTASKLLPLFIFAAAGLYATSNRFGDTSEYAMTRRFHDQVEKKFADLGPSDLIVMERDDAVMFEDIYPQLEDTPYTGIPRAVRAPHDNTHILYDPYMRRIYSEDLLKELFRQANDKRLLQGIDRLVFFYSLWPHSIAADLMACPGFPKKIITFPPLTGDGTPSRDAIAKVSAALMLVPKDIFINDVLSADGKANDCFVKAR